MAQTRVFRQCLRLLQQARRNNLQQQGLPPPLRQMNTNQKTGE
jgi:hypothetical protein